MSRNNGVSKALAIVMGICASIPQVGAAVRGDAVRRSSGGAQVNGNTRQMVNRSKVNQIKVRQNVPSQAKGGFWIGPNGKLTKGAFAVGGVGATVVTVGGILFVHRLVSGRWIWVKSNALPQNVGGNLIEMDESPGILSGQHTFLSQHTFGGQYQISTNVTTDQNPVPANIGQNLNQTNQTDVTTDQNPVPANISQNLNQTNVATDQNPVPANTDQNFNQIPKSMTFGGQGSVNLEVKVENGNGGSSNNSGSV